MTSVKDVFVLDANVFINANNTYYARDICNKFWLHLTSYNKQGTVCSIDRIYDELDGRQDDLNKWATENKAMFVSTHDLHIEQNYGKIVTWVGSKQYLAAAAKDEFYRIADGWLAAYALTTGYTLVTHEKPEPKSRKHIKLPDVCKEFNISYTDTFTMMRKIGMRLC